jgi:hypothetical protein
MWDYGRQSDEGTRVCVQVRLVCPVSTSTPLFHTRPFIYRIFTDANSPESS